MATMIRRRFVTAALVGCSARALPGSAAAHAHQGSATPSASDLVEAYVAQGAIRNYYRDNEAIEQFDIAVVGLHVFDTKEYDDAYWSQSTAEMCVPRPDDGVIEDVIDVPGVSSLGERTHIVIVTGTDDEPEGIEIDLGMGEEEEGATTAEPRTYLPSGYVTIQEGRIVASWETVSAFSFSYSFEDDKEEVAIPLRLEEEDYGQFYRLVHACSRDFRDDREHYTREELFGMLAGRDVVPGGWMFYPGEDAYYQRFP